MPTVGAAIQLNLQLFDGATDKYVRAYLKDASGNNLAASPVNLAHVGNGLYSDDSVLMPDTAQVTATYRVFTDSGYSSASADHSDALDVFEKTTEATATATVNLDQELSGIIETDLELVAALEADDSIHATIEEC
jgi:hypothetical protein